MKSRATSSSSSSKTSMSPHRTSHFTPIEEGNEEDEQSQGGRSSFRATPQRDTADDFRHHHHHPTPLHSEKSRNNKAAAAASPPKKQQDMEESTAGVSCNKCRPSNREKNTVVVPIGNGGLRRKHHPTPSSSAPSPNNNNNGIFKSILASLAISKKSPWSSSDGGSSSAASTRDDHWKIVVAELSNKVIHASRKRDEAILEASKLKHSMSELEKKLNKLEIYCHGLKSGLDAGGGSHHHHHHRSPSRANYHQQVIKVGNQERVIDHFLVLVSESRTCVRALGRALAVQLRQVGPKVYDRISLLLQPYDVKISFSRNPRALLVYMEALLNAAFFEDFESATFQKNGPSPILNPVDRCEANFAVFSRLHGLTWEAVLNKGTRHFSEEFSKFCDRKMSEIVAMLGWNRAWPEPLLQSFFCASKAVWLVHLLANSVHPGLPVFRVDKGSGFDPVYMEDMGGDRARKLVPSTIRIMVTPGFYVFDSVVKCKVVCRYYGGGGGGGGDVIGEFYDKGFTP